MATDAPDILTVDEAAEFLRVDRKSLYAAIAAGEVPALRVGRTIRVSREALVECFRGNLVLRSR